MQLSSEENLQITAEALRANGFSVHIAETPAEAKKIVFEIIPEGAEIMNNTSTTLDEIGVTEVLENSEKYVSIHKKVLVMDREKDGKRIKELRSVPEWAIGSFHAVTQSGHIMMASGSGSQIPGYAYGADHVVFVAGTHKIVKDFDEGMDRIYKHSLPLESERINKVYNTTEGSNVRKILILNSERDPMRIHVILVRKVLGF